MRQVIQGLCAVALAALMGSGCGGGTKGASGSFALIEFLDSGKANLARNRTLSFRFSAPILPGQDFPERMKIENIQSGVGNSNFARAIGAYIIVGENVTFVPRLPNKGDRSDAGLKANGNYHVFLKAGPDALLSADGQRLSAQQEFIFDTNQFFDDPLPTEPPRALQFSAFDPTLLTTTDLSRLSPQSTVLALKDSKDFIDNMRVIDPGAGGTAPFAAPWEFRLRMSEPLDPSTVNTDTVSLTEIFADATQSLDTDVGVSAADMWVGTSVSFRVPITVELRQGYDSMGALDVAIIVRPLGTLVDDTRYRITFSGEILGLDFRQVFIGRNGLTGDGISPLAGGASFPEPGGLGYVSEFIVRDRPTVLGTRQVLYSPAVDGINPEKGQTALPDDESRFNTALYDAASNPGRAVGFIGAFGTGKLGDLRVTSGTRILDTGDTLNEIAEIQVLVSDADPLPPLGTGAYKNTPGLPTPEIVTYEAVLPTEFDYESINVALNATVQIIGINPCRILSSGLVQINGTIDASGGVGGKGILPPTAATGGIGGPAPAGAAGPGGFAGGRGNSGTLGTTSTSFGGCNSYDTYVAAGGGRPAAFPKSLHGTGPGRGYAGGEDFLTNQQNSAAIGSPSGTGGGGGSHASAGTFGEDRDNGQSNGDVGAPIGQFGKCSRWGIARSSIIGLRGAPGSVYGDREALDFMGGSGGGAGGAMSGWNHAQNSVGSGGGGGGGGGFLEIISASNLVVTGKVTVAGGDGGEGDFFSWQGQAWTNTTGSGGGGSGGTVSLIAAEQVDLSGGMVTAAGGVGGIRATPDTGYTPNQCLSCNAGGDGGIGFIHLMDADGIVPGIDGGTQTPGSPGNFDSFPDGILSIRPFDANRFGGVNSITELFAMRVANPHFLPMQAGDIDATVAIDQSIAIRMTSARSDAVNPLIPDVTMESAYVDVALVEHVNGGVAFTYYAKPGGMPGDIMEDLNPSGAPLRDAFVRVVGIFNYVNAKEAALGPFMIIEDVLIRYDFN